MIIYLFFLILGTSYYLEKWISSMTYFSEKIPEKDDDIFKWKYMRSEEIF